MTKAHRLPETLRLILSLGFLAACLAVFAKVCLGC